MGWQDKVLADVRASGDSHHRGNSVFSRAGRPLQFGATTHFMKYIVAAAEQMGANRSTYVRRVLAVHAAHVLGVDVRTILWETPVARAWGSKTIPPPETKKGLRDDGAGIEAWCPHPGCTGEHLKPGLP